jgi:hypothetical protein
MAEASSGSDSSRPKVGFRSRRSASAPKWWLKAGISAFIQSVDVKFDMGRLCASDAFLGAKALMDDGKRHLQNGEGPSLTAERLLALFADSARRRSITRDIDPAPRRAAGSPHSRSAADRSEEIHRASTTMLLVAMALTLRNGDAEIGALLCSEDPDVRLASAFYLGDSG